MIEAQRLQEIFRSAKAAWPDLSLPLEVFARHLERHAEASANPSRALADVHGDDLYLACACAEGLAGAAEALEKHFFPSVVRAVARLDRSAAFTDEVKQVLRERLLLPRKDGQPGIAAYAGAGPLAGWLHIAARRTALNLMEGRAGKAFDDEKLLGGERARSDPELELLKSRFQPEFDRALREALEALSPRERLLLKMHYVDGLSMSQIGRMEGRNQSTISRAMSAARARLRDTLLRGLGRRLDLSDSQIQSIAGVVLSRLELSLGGALS